MLLLSTWVTAAVAELYLQEDALREGHGAQSVHAVFVQVAGSTEKA